MSDSRFDYPAPVAALGALDDASGNYRAEGWPDLVTQFGLTAEHVPDLIRMAHDLEGFWNILAEEDHDVPLTGYAPINAVHALGQLGVPDAIDSLIHLIHRNEAEEWDSDYFFDHIPSAIGLFGKPALLPVADYLADQGNPVEARAFLAASLQHMAEADPESRDGATIIATTQLAQHAIQDPWVNASLIDVLVELKAVKAASIMEAAFESGNVDLSLMGDWEDIQIRLGLLEERLTPVPQLEWVRELTPAPKTRKKAVAPKVNQKKQFNKMVSAKKKAKAKRKKKRKR